LWAVRLTYQRGYAPTAYKQCFVERLTNESSPSR
jgi:hypothetical protein